MRSGREPDSERAGICSYRVSKRRADFGKQRRCIHANVEFG